LASELRLRNVSFEDPVPKLKVPALAAEADAFLFNIVDAPVFRFGISSNKLFDFLSARRPIVFCCDAGNDPVKEAGAGITVRPGDPHALLDGMRRVAALGTQERRALGDSGRRWVEANHSYALLARRLARMLDSLPEVTR
jgi:glycosyltransferase involved in cell wall biosynthesis